MVAGGGADDDALCVAFQQSLQSGEAGQVKLLPEGGGQSVVFFVETQHLAVLQRMLCIIRCVHMPHAANGGSHSKYTGFPVLEDT